MPVVTDYDNKNPSWAQEHQPWSSEHHSRAQPGIQSKAKLPTPPPTLPDTRKEFPTLDIAQVGYIVYMDCIAELQGTLPCKDDDARFTTVPF